METPKDKAEQLVNKYFNLFVVDLENTISRYEAIECAKIVVEKMINECDNEVLESNDVNRINFWQEVKKELNKL